MLAMTKRLPKPLTDEQGAMLRERAEILGFFDTVHAGLAGQRHRVEVIDAYLMGAKIPLDTSPPPGPTVTLVVDNEPPEPNRAQKRAAARASKRTPVKRGQATKKKTAKKAPKLTPNAAS